MKRHYILFVFIALCGLVHAQQERDTIDAFPYSTSFEVGQDTNWIFANASANRWCIGSAAHSGDGARSLYISNNNGASNNYSHGNCISYAYRPLLMSAGEYAVSFNWMAYGEQNYDYLRVFLIPGHVSFNGGTFPTGYNYPYNFREAVPTGWIDLANGQLRGQNTWQTFSTTVELLDDTTYYLVFIWVNDGSGGSSPAGTIDNINIIANTCPAPTGLTLDHATSDSLLFHWTPGGSESYWIVTIGDYIDYVYDTSYIAYDLQSNTLYPISVRAYCDVDDTSLAIGASFRTLCGPITSLPFIQDFESLPAGSSASFDPCWAKGENVTNASPWVSGTDNKVFYGRITTFGRFFYLLFPPLDDGIDINTLELTFDLHASPTNISYTNAYITVAVADNDTALRLGIYDSIGFYHTEGGDWETHTASFSQYSGNRRSIAILMPYGGTYSENYLDNLNLHLAPTCERPGPLSLSAVTHDSIALSWPLSPNAEHYTLSYCLPDDSSWTSVDVYDTVASVSGLLPNTTYIFALSSYCGMGLSSDSATASFRTLCAPTADFPWVENFDSAATGNVEEVLSCWRQLTPRTLASNNVTVADAEPFSGSHHLQFDRSEPTGCIVAFPPFDTVTNALEMSFMHRPENHHQSYCGTLRLGYLTDLADTSTFVTIAEWNTASFANDNYRLERFSFDTLPDHAFLAFKHSTPTRNSWDWYVDNITIRPISPCRRPGDIYVTDATSSSLTLTIDDVNDNYAAWLTLGDSIVDSTTVTAANSLLFSSGLAQATTYTVHVARICDGERSDETTALATTGLDAATLPYSTGFEPSDDNAWLFLNGVNAWTLGSAVNNGGSNALYISANGTTNYYYTTSTSYSFAYKTFSIDAGRYSISFDWRANGEAEYDYLRAFLVPDTVVLTPDNNNDIYYDDYPLDWIAITAGTLQGQTLWQHFDTTLSLDANGVYRLLFYWTNDFMDGSNPPAAIDNLLFQQALCATPANLVVSDISASGATLSWSAGASETSWAVTLDDTTVIVNDSSLLLSTLAPNTTYSVALRAICAEGDTSLAATTVFTTDTLPILWRTVTLAVNDSTMGSALGAGSYPDSSTVTLAATPFEGFRFLGWSLSPYYTAIIPDNPYSFTVTSDITATAYFEAIPADTLWRTVTVNTNVEGACETYGSGRYPDSSLVEIGYTMVDTATAGGHWQFLGWSDGANDTPRTLLVLSDTIVTALFEWVADSTGVGIGEVGDNSYEIMIYPNPAHNAVTISVDQPSTITLLDMNGRVVITAQSLSHSATLPLNDLSAGTYFVRVTSNSSTAVRKLIVK